MGVHVSLGGGSKAPLSDTQSRQEFIHGEGLSQVVVSSRVQCLDFVSVFAPRADDNDRDSGPGADLADQVHAVHVRQPKVKEDDVRIVGCDLQESVRG